MDCFFFTFALNLVCFQDVHWSSLHDSVLSFLLVQRLFVCIGEKRLRFPCVCFAERQWSETKPLPPPLRPITCRMCPHTYQQQGLHGRGWEEILHRGFCRTCLGFFFEALIARRVQHHGIREEIPTLSCPAPVAVRGMLPRGASLCPRSWCSCLWVSWLRASPRRCPWQRCTFPGIGGDAQRGV